jgi:hypothetical protein
MENDYLPLLAIIEFYVAIPNRPPTIINCNGVPSIAYVDQKPA